MMVWLLALALNAPEPVNLFHAGDYAGYLRAVSAEPWTSGYEVPLLRLAVALELGGGAAGPELQPAHAEVVNAWRQLLTGQPAGWPVLQERLSPITSSWFALADTLEKVKVGRDEADRFRRAATCLRVLGVARPGARDNEVGVALDGLAWLPPDLQQPLIELLVTMSSNARPGFDPTARLQSGLKRRLSQGELKDPVMVDLAFRLVTSPTALMALATDLAQQGRSPAAIDCAHRAVAAAAGDFDLTLQAILTLYQAGDYVAAEAELRELGKAAVYPRRRIARLAWLRLLSAPCPTCGDRTDPGAAGPPTIEAALAGIEAAVKQDPGDCEARIAMGDAWLVRRHPVAAANEYLSALQQASSSDARLGSWLGLAETQPAEAWAMSGLLPGLDGAGAWQQPGWGEAERLAAVLATAVTSTFPGQGAELLESWPAATWSDGTPNWQQPLGAGLLWALAAEPEHAADALSRALAAEPDRALAALLQTPQGELPCESRSLTPTHRGLAAASLRQRVTPTVLWPLLLVANDQITAGAETGQPVANVWSQLLRAVPWDQPDAVAAVSLATDQAAAWLAAHQDTPGAAYAMVEAAAQAIAGRHWQDRWPLCDVLLDAALAAGQASGLRYESIRPRLRQGRDDLRRAGASAVLLQQFDDVVMAYYGVNVE